MLAVVGSPSFVPGPTPDAAGEAGGLAAGVARAAAAAGVEVQLVGKVGGDPAGDAVLLSLARGGVGHLALLRDAGLRHPDASAGLRGRRSRRYGAACGARRRRRRGRWAGEQARSARGATRSRAAARARPAPRTGRHLARAALPARLPRAGCRGPARRAVGGGCRGRGRVRRCRPCRHHAGRPGCPRAPFGAIVLEAPEDDPAGAFAALVGRFAASLDRGVDAAEAFRTAIDEGGWERAAG